MSKILDKSTTNVFDNIAEKSKTPYYKTNADCYNAVLMIMVEEELEKTRIALNKELIRLSKSDHLKTKENPIQIESIQTTANIAIEVLIEDARPKIEDYDNAYMWENNMNNSKYDEIYNEYARPKEPIIDTVTGALQQEAGDLLNDQAHLFTLIPVDSDNTINKQYQRAMYDLHARAIVIQDLSAFITEYYLRRNKEVANAVANNWYNRYTLNKEKCAKIIADYEAEKELA